MSQPSAAVIDEKVMNTYCFSVASTYTVISPLNSRPGVGPESYIFANGSHIDAVTKTHSYYRWVTLVLFLQAVSFWLPSQVWMWHQGGVADIISKLQGCDAKVTKQVAKYFLRSRNTHGSLLFGWFLSAGVSLLLVVLNFFLCDVLLGGDFKNYGIKVWHYLMGMNFEENDPFSEIFPLETKCKFHKYGPSGSIVVVDALCIIPLNTLNEKTYFFLWFWLYIMAVSMASCIFLKLLSLMVMACTPFVKILLNYPMGRWLVTGTTDQAWSKHSEVPTKDKEEKISEAEEGEISEEEIDERELMAVEWWLQGDKKQAVYPMRWKLLLTQLAFSDWVFLRILTSNMGPFTYTRFMRRLYFLCKKKTRNGF